MQQATEVSSIRRQKSSAQKPKRPLPMVLLRLLFRSFGLMAPASTARLANYLWFRPQRHNPPAREEVLLLEARCYPLRHAGKQISVYAWGTGPTVLLVHGWSGRGAQLGEFVQPLVDNGYRVVAFDAPAHGRSTGEETTLPEISDLIQRIAQEFAPAHAVIAHSFGVACALYALRTHAFAQRFVAIGAPATLDDLLRVFAAELALPTSVVTNVRQLIAQRFGADAWDRFSPQVMARQMTMPALIVHDTDDRDIPWQGGAALANAWPQAQFLRTDGLSHRRLLRDADVIARIVHFIGPAAP
ncbi:MAG: alpha/beta fold hydrolase [Gammaproteobacteria bacterium]|nr:alpha/beta fold hydrolase [Gammaproteobacteria bacterium]